MSRKQTIVRLAVEMALLVALAAIVGGIWNFRLLMNAWSGKTTATAPATGDTPMSLPLPLGLMQVKELFDKNEAVIVDARERNAYSTGHIKGAVSLPLSESATAIAEFGNSIPKKAILIVYCSGYACEDSIELGKRLIGAGYGTVYYFDGGFPAWRDAGYPVAKR